MGRGFGFRWSRAKEELSEELEAHLRMAVADRVARGEDPRRAREQALRELGNIPLIEDVTRESWGWVWLEHLVQDCRLAFRQLRGAKGFTLTVLLTLALGIGANLAVFQLIHSVILARLPVERPEELLLVRAAKSPFDEAWIVSYDAYRNLRATAKKDVALLAHTAQGGAILQVAGGESSEARYELVSDNYFQALGIYPSAGRFFLSSDGVQQAGEWPAIIRHELARDMFGSPEKAVGKRLLLNSVPCVIVGVANKRFLGESKGYPPDFWLPLEAQGSGHLNVAFDSLGPGHGIDLKKPWVPQRGVFWLTLIARAPEGERTALAAQWSKAFQPDRELMSAATTDPAEKAARLRGQVEFVSAMQGQGGLGSYFVRPLWLLMALSLAVFLVGCLNLANLQVARLSAREQELSVRVALGASRLRLLLQVVMEDLLLVIPGGALALLTGQGLSRALMHWASSKSDKIQLDLHLNGTIATIGLVLMLTALLLFSLFPALHFMRSGLRHSAGAGSRTLGTAQSRLSRWRSNTMLAAQVSLSLLLATMAGCFLATLLHWEQMDVGLDREHVLSVSLDMGRSGYAAGRRDLPELYRRMQEQLATVPGVKSSAVEMCSLLHCGWNTALYPYGRGGLSQAQLHGAEDHVGPDFFRTVGIPLLRGRDFSSTDSTKTQRVAILSESFAHQLFGAESPIGHWIGYEPPPNDHKFLVVGEVADARMNGAQVEAPPKVYMSVDQTPSAVQTVQVRTLGSPAEIAGSVRQALLQVDPKLPIREISTLDEELNNDLGTEKLLTRLAMLYAALTLLLVAIGFYGVMAYRTARRTSEFGIRLALGASRRHIRWLVVGQSAGILLAGFLPGVLLSIGAVRLARHLLAGSLSANLTSAILSAVVLALAGVGAVLLPAQRAAEADPLKTLRAE